MSWDLEKKMFCTACGQKLDGVAHVVNNELLCDNCFAKLGQGHEPDAQHTVYMNQISEDQRISASNSIPKESVPEVNLQSGQASTAPSPQAPTTPPAHPMISGEQILWKRTFSKGIIHKEATLTEVITNKRVVVIDDEQKKIVRAAPLGAATVAVTNTKRDYTNVHTGFERYGAYTGVGKGTGVTIGNVEIFIQGRIVLTLTNIRDPYGLKQLIDSAVKSSER